MTDLLAKPGAEARITDLQEEAMYLCDIVCRLLPQMTRSVPNAIRKHLTVPACEKPLAHAVGL
ncbi:MAG: hypothetical protein H7293_16960 [Candidatus Saccharibacteria bacterium]|nr:hypothetical protein [Rhodoferax sp.]